MSYNAEVYNVMLASPSDVNDERQIAQHIIHDWNNIHSKTRKIVLLPLSWEYNVAPSMGNRPQAIINEKVLKYADILIGIFWTRIGTPTGKAISGSVEEIDEHIKSDKPTMLYFSNKPVLPDSIDPEQYKAVKNLKKKYQSNGITKDFDSVDDFRTKFQRHLAIQLNEPEYLISGTETFEFESGLNTTDIKRVLSKESKELLKEASKDIAGEIMKLSYIGGFIFQTNGKQMNEDDSPRTKAKWEAAIDELLNLDLIYSVGYKGDIYHLTDKGFKLADELI